MKIKNKFLNKILSITLISLLLWGNILPFRATIITAQETTQQPVSETTPAPTTETTPQPTSTPTADQIREQELARREAEKQAAIQAREAQTETERALRRGEITPTPTPIITQPPVVEEQVATITDTTSKSGTADVDTTSGTGASADNNNSATVNNNNQTTSNSGNNVVSGNNPSSVTPTQAPETVSDPLPACKDSLNNEESNAGEENNLLYESTEVSPTQESQLQENNTSQAQQESTTTDNDTVTVENSNCASISNDQYVSSTSGNNNLSNNDSVKGQTGEATADSNLINKGNVNSTTNTSSDATGGEGGVNKENVDSLAVDNNNQIYAQNEVNVESTSGANSVNNNDGHALLSTGDVDMMVTLMNILNMNITGEDFTHLIVNIFGDLTGDVDLNTIASHLGMSEKDFEILLENEERMAEKQEEINERAEKEAKINNNNEAVVVNDVNVKGVSGQNELSSNEDKTVLMTGRVKILVALINFINTNYSGSEWYFAMVNVFGSLNGDLILPDPNNFLEGQGTALAAGNSDFALTDTQNTSVTNTNNVQIDNNIKLIGDSGSNVAYANEDQVKQTTGNVTTATNLSNWLNINILGNHWVLLVINVFGTWYGQILGFPGQDPVSSPGSGTLVLSAGGSNNSGPTITQGSNSQNTNSENTTVNNQNSAIIENNVNVEGISGQNTTNQNEDPVFVTTGWVDITTDILNIVNMNVTGKKWMLVMVNVFGDFFGDITFPGVKKESAPEFKAEGELVEELVQIGGQNNSDENQSNSQENTVTVSNTTKPKVQILSYIQVTSDSKSQQDYIEPKVETYKAANYENVSENNQQTDESKILGISVDSSNTTASILFLVAVISYLIALRFLAFRKTA